MDRVVEALLGLSPALVLALVLLLPTLEASTFLGLVVPGETVVLVGGALAHEGRLPLWAVVVAAFAGAVAGDQTGYLVGRRYGRRLLARMPRRLVRSAELRWVGAGPGTPPGRRRGGGRPVGGGAARARTGDRRAEWAALAHLHGGQRRRRRGLGGRRGGARLPRRIRDAHTPHHPNVWGLPGGHWEPGETIAETAVRELREETGLAPEASLRPFAVQELPQIDRVKHYYWGRTEARQEDVVLGEGAAIVFVPADELFDGRPYTPGTPDVLARFLTSPEYAEALAAGRARTAG
ncbi:NUDIX domain-containing protein [Micromonospora sp. B11E3]|uniref:NUDIX domain-containing protein n=1 Tax=Micromonospora sp. B11E3 TaxID=3153562 RepID=UPI00325E455D